MLICVVQNKFVVVVLSIWKMNNFIHLIHSNPITILYMFIIYISAH
jgi:hypothetical protein